MQNKKIMVVDRKYLSANNIKNLNTLTLFFPLFSFSYYLINAPWNISVLKSLIQSLKCEMVRSSVN